MSSSLWTPPNLLSLSRVVIAPFVIIALSVDSLAGTLVAVALVILAGITDGLDGYLARKSGQSDRIGATIDPLADKVFAVIVVVGLILYRDFPLWLAGLIIVRDLLIVSAGAILVKQRDAVMPSNLTGKYAFASIAVLMGSATIRFDYGTQFLTWVCAVLLIASMINYTRVFVAVRSGKSTPLFVDSPMKRQMRLIGILAVAGWLGVDFVKWMRGYF
ncbi:MAG: CDP-alcohol phosphatidyltransferase family protein [Candidatus Zixiibacteriota bacterium]